MFTTVKFVKNHVVRNRAKYAAVTTATAAGYLMHQQKLQMDEFLTEHNLLNEYYARFL